MESDEKPATKIRCIRPECNSTGEFQFIGEASDLKKAHITIVDSDGKIVYHKTTYYYKCMACHATFESDIAPIHKRMLHG